MRKLKTEDFIARAREIHGGKYDYSKVQYTGRHDPVIIICPVHGQFVQEAGTHLKPCGCPSCGKRVKAEKRAKPTPNSRKLTEEQFIQKVKLIHGDKYDYTLCGYTTTRSKIKVICPVHGEFSQKANDHMSGNGCPSCGGTRRLTTNDVIARSREIHGGRYDYSETVYVNAKKKIKIICSVHGVFEQTAHSHFNGNGCPKCACVQRGDALRWDAHGFMKRAREIHGDKYDYSHVKYTKSVDNVDIICQKHGKFSQRPDMHINQQQGCPRCAIESTEPSKSEQAVFDYIKSVCPDAIQSDRNVITPFELDVIVPSLKLAVEFNGIYWHSEKYRDDTYHINKRKMTEQAGYRLISIREDLWNERRPQIEAIIDNAIGVNTRRIYARKCSIVAADKDTAATFFDANHVQGNRAASQYWSLVHNGEIVAVMSATHWRKKDEWELVRYATSCNVVGGLSKLWKHIVKVNDIAHAYSYVDRDLFTGRSYAHAGFRHNSTTVGFRIVTNKTTESRQKWNNAPEGLTQNEWYEREGVYRIYDAGQDKLIFG